MNFAQKTLLPSAVIDSAVTVAAIFKSVTGMDTLEVAMFKDISHTTILNFADQVLNQKIVML